MAQECIDFGRPLTEALLIPSRQGRRPVLAPATQASAQRNSLQQVWFEGCGKLSREAPRDHFCMLLRSTKRDLWLSRRCLTRKTP